MDQLEQVNIQDGLRWLARQKNPDVLTEQFVRQLHQQLFGEVREWAGTFRNTEKSIGIAPEQIAVALRNLLDDVRYWIKHEIYTPREIGLRFHHSLVKIHLFPNGNGRHARIIADALLDKILHEKPVDWSDRSLQNAGRHRSEYIAALKRADTGDYQALLDKFSVKEP